MYLKPGVDSVHLYTSNSRSSSSLKLCTISPRGLQKKRKFFKIKALNLPVLSKRNNDAADPNQPGFLQSFYRKMSTVIFIGSGRLGYILNVRLIFLFEIEFYLLFIRHVTLLHCKELRLAAIQNFHSIINKWHYVQ